MLDNEIDPQTKKKGRRKRGIYLLPNLLTSASLFGGFYSIIASFDGHFVAAAVAILISGVFDCLDGRIARLTGTTSKFGVEYDSLADLVAFGLAPGVLIFTWALKPYGRYGWLAAFLYVVCAALRLARFNVQVTAIESKNFKGLPVPAAALLIASSVLMFFYFDHGETTKHITVLVFTYTLAFLMVSNIKYYSFKELNLSQRMPFWLLVAIIFLAIVIAAEPEFMIFVVSFLYVLSGPVVTLASRRKRVFAKAAKTEEKKDHGLQGRGGVQTPLDKRVYIFDTTLRDGEQSPGASMNVEEKLLVARQLAKLGVDIIEAGFAVSSPGDFESVRRIACEVEGPVICSLARARPGDIDSARDALKEAPRPRIHTFISTSDIHLKHQFRMSRDEALRCAVDMVERARGYVDDVEFSPMDASRSESAYLYEVLEAVIEAGASTVNIPDTVGYTIPHLFGALIKGIKENVLQYRPRRYIGPLP